MKYEAGQMILFFNPANESEKEVVDRGFVVEVDDRMQSLTCLMNLMGRQVVYWDNPHIEVLDAD